MYVVLVADTDISADASDAEIVGPFPTEQAAIDWGFQEERWIVQILPVNYREPTFWRQ